MLNNEQLQGNEIGWINWGIKCYNTNFGQVELDEKTEELVFCCISLGNNQGNTRIGVKIIDEEFQIYKDYFGTIYSELCSDGFPNPARTLNKIGIEEVINILQNDDNDSVAAVLVKKELIRLMYNKLHFGRSELIALSQLLKSWRKPIRKLDLNKEVKRVPIITKTTK